MLCRQDVSREIDRRLRQLRQTFGSNLAAPAACFDPAAEPDHEILSIAGRRGRGGRCRSRSRGASSASSPSVSKPVTDGQPSATVGNVSCRKHVPITRGGEFCRQPSCLGSHQFELAQRHHRPHQVERGSQAAQRDAKLMHPLGIATVLGSGQRLEQMQEDRSAGSSRECLIERCGGIETKLWRLRCAAGGVSAARSKPRADLLRIDGFTEPCSASRNASS